jgi:protein-L-isoaspartate(D-aspartate) O-methyltransferase
MVTEQIERRGVTDERVLSAMRTVPRHVFVPAERRAEAYEDRALPLGVRQSISQPYIVARMTELAAPSPGHRVLEIGTGSGYQAAVLAELCDEVYTIDSDPELVERATETLSRMHYRGVHLRCGDGRSGWPEAAPFAAVLVTACSPEVPPDLVAQLEVGGRLVMPRGRTDRTQTLTVHVKRADGGLTEQQIQPVRFVPLD